MSNYIAIVHKDEKSDFGVSFPDFPGCITAGKNIDMKFRPIIPRHLHRNANLTASYSQLKAMVFLMVQPQSCHAWQELKCEKGI